MTTLMPEKPGHWSEHVLLAFPDAVICHEPGEEITVRLPLASDADILFTGPVGLLRRGGDLYYAHLQEFDKSHGLDREMQIANGGLTHVIETTNTWFQNYLESTYELEAMIAAAEAGALEA